MVLRQDIDLLSAIALRRAEIDILPVNVQLWVPPEITVAGIVNPLLRLPGRSFSIFLCQVLFVFDTHNANGYACCICTYVDLIAVMHPTGSAPVSLAPPASAIRM